MKKETVVTRTLVETTTELRGVASLVAGGGDELDLKPERVQEWLQAWPAWKAGANGKTLVRQRTFGSGEAAERFGAFVAALAADRGLPIKTAVNGSQIDLTLYSGRRRGHFRPLTESVLALGAEIG